MLENPQGSSEVATSLSQNGNGAASTRAGAEREEENVVPREWREEFEVAARRPLSQRLRYAFIKTHKPVLDDVPYRAFDSMEEYRAWCEENLPMWLGYGR